MTDTFRGDNARLIDSAEALLSLDAAGAIGPNGIGGHARDIIAAFIARLPRAAAALAAFDEDLARIGGCTDGGCVIVKPRGMHTNGGCKCPRDQIKMQHYIQAVNRMRAKLVSGAGRTVVVEVKNEILGDSVFWRGPATAIGGIHNIPARETAALVVKDGKARVCGMWHVRIEEGS
jgi:hypothetical protein